MLTSEIAAMRLKRVLLSDKVQTPARLTDVIKSDLQDVFANYLDINGDIDMNLSPDQTGGFSVVIKLNANAVKTIHTLP